jgi:hypothetical protein
LNPDTGRGVDRREIIHDGFRQGVPGLRFMACRG